jgi:uncharacterized phage protein (TIGR02220 family)
MGMEFARLYFDFFDSEKIENLLEECGDHGVVCLQRLWVRAGIRNNDGIFKKSPRALEKLTKWKGKKGKLVETLLDEDFPLLDQIGEKEFQLHNWLKNNEHLSEKSKEMRSKRARQAALTRWNKDANRMQEASSEDANRMLNHARPMLSDANVTKGNVTEQNLTKDTVGKSEKKVDKRLEIYQRIIDDLNLKAERRFTLTKKTVSLMNSRWKEKWREKDFLHVNTVCCFKWKGDPEHRDHLIPLTLYNGNFEKRMFWELPKKKRSSLVMTDEEREEFENRNPF